MSENMVQDILRADQALVQRGLAASRERAQDLIANGLVYANGKQINKPAQKIAAEDRIEVRGESCPYVSRGGFKLEKALKAFSADVRNKICVDIGASTGGFTDVLLQNGAKHVYAVDVGTGQLDPKIENDPRVTKMEQTNARTLTAEDFPLRPE
ncbi:MAG: TlyA family RNA methyltransferase, partial [Clostridia bacterium]|nr:TlyA family RNA methyltransferase [Clostridia bacterium]